jgi:hypothetical protein
MFRQRPQSASMPSVRSFSSCWWLAARLAVNRVRAGGQPQFQVETGASWAVVVFDITVFLSKRAQRPDAVGGSGGAGSGRGQRFSPSSRSRREQAGRWWCSTSRCSFRSGRNGPMLWGGPAGAGSGRGQRFSPSSRSRPGQGWSSCSSSRIPSKRTGAAARRCQGALVCWSCWERKTQPQFQVETGPTWATFACGVVHCWVASCASIDSMALTSVFIGSCLSKGRIRARKCGYWPRGLRRREQEKTHTGGSSCRDSRPSLDFADRSLVKPACRLHTSRSVCPRLSVLTVALPLTLGHAVRPPEPVMRE